jgi:hypothetical protein
LADGQVALNTNLGSPGLFFKDSNGDLVKAGPVHVGATAPNVTPASGGTAGNSKGEAWLDTSGTNPLLKVWSGSTWQTVQPVVNGNVVSTADTGTVTSAMIADGTIVNADINASAAIADTKLGTISTAGKVSGTAITSGNISTSGSFTSTSTVTGTNLIPTGSSAPTNGIYLPATNSVALTTAGTDRLYIDASGNIGSGTAVPATLGGGGQLVLQRTGGSRMVIASNTRRFYITGASGSDDLRIGARISSDTADQDALTITTTGVGIGTTSPAAKLTVANDANTNATIKTVGLFSGNYAGTIGSGAKVVLTATDGISRGVAISGVNVGRSKQCSRHDF